MATPKAEPARAAANPRVDGSDHAIPSAIPVSLYIVNANEQTVMTVTRRWARIAKLDFSWTADIDYPITDRMRRIETSDLAAAIAEIRASIAGASVPLAVEIAPTGLSITRLQPAIASSATPIATAPRAVAPVQPASAAFPAPASSPAQLAMTSPAQAATSSTSFIQEKTWDAPARKAAGIPIGHWLVGDKRSLRAVVEAWAKETGYQVDWKSQQDPAVTDAVRAGTYPGTFKDALMQLAAAFGEFRQPLGMSFQTTPGGKVLQVYDL